MDGLAMALHGCAGDGLRQSDDAVPLAAEDASRDPAGKFLNLACSYHPAMHLGAGAVWGLGSRVEGLGPEAMDSMGSTTSKAVCR